MPRLTQRGSGVAVLSNDDRAIAWFPDAGSDVGVSVYSDLDEARLRAEGLVAQLGPRQYVTTSASTTSGVTRIVAASLRKGVVLGAAWVGVAVNGAGLTLAKVGVWNTAGALLAGTGDFSAGLSAGAANRGASASFATPYVVPADGLYYVGLLQVGTTPAQVGLLSNTAAAVGWPLVGTVMPHGSLSGQTDLAGFTPPLLVSAVNPWIGFS